MLRFLFLSLLACMSLSLDAQCPVTDITLATQTAINSFSTDYPGCTSPAVSITIEESTPGNITDLTGLAGISTINGSLSIKNCTMLSSLTGINTTSVTGTLEVVGISQLTDLSDLASITTAGGIVVNFNNNLTSLNGLQGITTTSALDVISNGNLPNLSGLDNLAVINGLTRINSNFTMLNFSGLGSLTQVNGTLQILSNAALQTISGMAALTYINGQFQISNNALLTSVGVPILATVNGQFNITNNASLTNMTGLEALLTIGGAQLEISGNANLTSLSGLNNFTITNGALNIDGNTQLSDCVTSAICTYLDAPTGGVLISANTLGCDSQAEVAAACATAPVELTKFVAIPRTGQVNLIWETASEINNEGFHILHSENGRDFSPIGYMDGVGFSTRDIEYLFIHDYPLIGKNYYQLAQVDFDGTTSYSPIVLTNTEKAPLQIFPNPTRDEINVEGILPETYKVIISDLTGIVKLIDEHHTGTTISLKDLSAGYYVVQIFNHTKPTVFSIIKK